MKSVSERADAVAELQGLEGAFSFAELLLQRIWSRLDFDRARAFTVAGEPLRIIEPGRWNRSGGPDFFEAKFEIGGRRITGDIEVHLRASDWESHRHAQNMAYSRVALHVVLFPTSSKTTRGWDGGDIPVIVLLPLLNRSLEEYADDDAVERLANHPFTKARDALLALPIETQRETLEAAAAERWERKKMLAALKIDHLGWSEACHHTALEILGYRFNRAPMVRIAERWPLASWQSGEVDVAVRAFASEAGHWRQQAIRPANLPELRLKQYSLWVAARPDWPKRLGELAATLPERAVASGMSTGQFRKTFRCAKIVRRISDEILGGTLSGPRLDTMICDGFWPLVAARDQKRAQVYEPFWQHAYPGDLPQSLREIAKALTASDSTLRPLANGVAQGLLSWCSRPRPTE